MGKVSVEGGIVARELKPGLPNDKQHELAAERKPGVRPETALARDRHARIRAMLEGRGDLASAASSCVPVRSISRVKVPNRSVSKLVSTMQSRPSASVSNGEIARSSPRMVAITARPPGGSAGPWDGVRASRRDE